MPRNYDLSLSEEYDISRHRYRELKEFCLQYDEKKLKLKQLYTSSTVPPEVAVMGGVPGNPTQSKAMYAIQWKNDIELIDNALNEACGADIGIVPILKRNITEGIGYESLGYVPCSSKTFYRYRRKFFFLLDKEKF